MTGLPGCPQCGSGVAEVHYGDKPHEPRRALLAEVTGAVDPYEFRLQPCGHRVGGYLMRSNEVQRWSPVPNQWMPVELTITDEVDRKFVFNGDEAGDVWVDKP